MSANIKIPFDVFKIGDKVRTTNLYINRKGFHWTGTIVRLAPSFPGGMVDIKLDKKFRHLFKEHGAWDIKCRYIRIANWGKNWPSDIKVRGGK